MFDRQALCPGVVAKGVPGSHAEDCRSE